METAAYVPNSGRLVDYWLGGSHHFPAEVEVCQIFDSVYPHFPKVFRMLRNYIGRASRYIASQGIDQFVVFASGIPTCDNVHENVPEAKVLYTDIDPVNIKLGQEILAHNSNAFYTFCDITNIDMLDRSILTQSLGSIRRLGMICVGLQGFMSDEILAKAYDRFYDWAPPGSFLALDFEGEAAAEPKMKEILESMGLTIYTRNSASIKPLLGRWQLTEHGILPVEAWQSNLQIKQTEIKEPAFHYVCVAYK
ncbi:MAG: SAM-dependent methyltransferase [Nostoc desertorum CM1-VF14]|jgi:hypothetical protein|nr:SAM-dependent methyltransferase [Nostoc desertorum CM1-VF14]